MDNTIVKPKAEVWVPKLKRPDWLNKAKKKEGLRVALSDKMFSFLQRILNANYPNESAGLGEIVNNQVTWLWWDKQAQASPGGVGSSEGRGHIAALQAGREVNLQLHTHPTFNTSFSATDDDDQRQVVEPLLRSRAEGHVTFMVYNAQSFRLRRVHYSGGEVTLVESGFCTNGGIVLNIGHFSRTAYIWPRQTGKKQTPKTKIMNHEPLFEIVGVEYGDWPSLKEKIDIQFGEGMYDLVLDNPDLWEFLDQGVTLPA